MYPNPLKQKLNSGQILLGTSLPVPSPIVLGVISQAQPDFLWIDTEHTPFSTEVLDVIPILARQKRIAPMIRVAWNDPALIKKAYDVEAVAVMAPQIPTHRRKQNELYNTPATRQKGNVEYRLCGLV